MRLGRLGLGIGLELSIPTTHLLVVSQSGYIKSVVESSASSNYIRTPHRRRRLLSATSSLVPPSSLALA